MIVQKKKQAEAQWQWGFIVVPIQHGHQAAARSATQTATIVTYLGNRNEFQVGGGFIFSDMHQNTVTDDFIWLTTEWLLALHVSFQAKQGGCRSLNFTPEPKYSLES